MFTIYKKEVLWGGRTLTLETGKIARQADGSVVATYGNTVVMANVTFAKQAKEGVDFFPLTVNYQEKFYAAGRIPGGFFKREGRPSEKETLTSRLIDRPIRPLFPKQFKNETQVVVTVLSHDGENNPDIPALVAASAALTLSGVPFLGPIAGARVGYVDGAYVLNPTKTQMANSQLDLVVAGTGEGVLMVESEASELSEEIMLGAVTFGHEACKPLIDAIIELAEAAAKPGFDLPESADTAALHSAMEKALGADIVAAYKLQEKQARRTALDTIKERAMAEFTTETSTPAEINTVASLLKSLESDVLRGDVLKNKKRIDGRTPVDIRPIVAEVDVLPRVHGSALFTRGETQALVVATLGSGKDEQIVDAIEGEYKDRFMLHYNFPPYSVGEVGRMGAPGRREIGHGKLAYRALARLLPSEEAWPYITRVVSEITESNGSSSMATVCGSSLALMAAGVPLPRPVAGIAMGLVKEGNDYVVLSDIMGDEDHLGDMDFKVAGTSEGVTALQMDIKITSITPQIMEIALKQAKEGRMHILGKMAKAITEARSNVAETAPGMASFYINKEKIRDVIGSGGKVIRQITEDFNCSVDIEEDGLVKVAAVDRLQLEQAVAFIKGLVAEAEVGTVYTGPVVNITDFGAFVRILPNVEALVHISEMVPVRVGQVSDIVAEGEEVTVKVLEIDERGKVRLTMKELEQTGTVADRCASVIASGGTQRPERKEGDRNGGGNGRRDDRRNDRSRRHG